MASTSPMDTLDGYESDHIKQMAQENGIDLRRKRIPQLKKELRAHFAAIGGRSDVPAAPATAAPAGDAAPAKKKAKPSAKAKSKSSPNKITKSTKSKARKPTTKRGKRTASVGHDESAEETAEESATTALDSTSPVYTRLYHILQHVRTTRSEFINEEQEKLLQPSIDGLAEVVEALEAMVPTAPTASR